MEGELAGGLRTVMLAERHGSRRVVEKVWECNGVWIFNGVTGQGNAGVSERGGKPFYAQCACQGVRAEWARRIYE